MIPKEYHGSYQSFHELWDTDHYHIGHLHPSSVLDIGANIGAFSLLMLTKNPNCYIHAYEPGAENYENLLYNLAIEDPLGHVHPHESAIYTGDTPVLISGHEGLIHICDDGLICAKSGCSRYQGLQFTSVTSFHDAMLSFETLDLLKMDVEGAEFVILNDADPDDLSRISHICMEFHDYFGETERLNLLAKLSFTHDIIVHDFTEGRGGIWRGTLR